MYSVPVSERKGVFGSSDTPIAQDGDVKRRETSKIEHFRSGFSRAIYGLLWFVKWPAWAVTRNLCGPQTSPNFTHVES